MRVICPIGVLCRLSGVAETFYVYSRTLVTDRDSQRRKNMKCRNLIGAIAALFAVSAALPAQSCSLGPVTGTYAWSCSGWVTVAAPATVVPMVGLGTATVDADGHFSGTYTQSVAGNVTSGKNTGKLTVKPDCTATIQYQVDNDTVTVEHQGALIPQTGEVITIFSKNPYMPTTAVCKFTHIAR